MGGARPRGSSASGADQCYQVKLAMSEAVANAIQHGSADRRGPDPHLRPGLAATPSSSRSGTRASSWSRRSPELSERGRGLVLVALVMDEVELTPGEDGSVLRFVKRLEPAAS